jgi:N-acetylglucosamine repressor
MVRNQPSLLRQINERAVFELLRSRGPTSRADLTRHIGVSAPTVSKAIANLLDAGWVEEVGIAAVTGAGRPGKLYRLSQGSVQVLGATIDVRRCCVLAASLDGIVTPASALEFPTPGSYGQLIAAMASRAETLMRRPGVATLGLGISTPGEIDVQKQKVLLSPNLHMTDGRSPGRDLQDRLGVETVMFHETVGTCLYEQHFGMARGMKDFAMVGVYEGFGVSIVTDGRLVRGHEGMAGELGHVTVDLNGPRCGCGNNGCLETLATDVALARAVSQRLGRTLEVERVVSLARNNEIDIAPELARTLEYLAVGIAAVINIFNPEAVLVCSRMLDADPEAFVKLKRLTERRTLAPLMRCCRILRAEGNTRTGAVAAILQHLTSALGPVID